MPQRALALFLATLLGLGACVPAAPPATGVEGVEWLLVGIEGTEVPWRASIRFDGTQIAGQAPCNRWFGQNAAALPAVAITAIGATEMACADLAAESVFFEALQAMQRAELDQGHLYLIGAEGRIMEFARQPGEPCLSCLVRQ